MKEPKRSSRDKDSEKEAKEGQEKKKENLCDDSIEALGPTTDSNLEKAGQSFDA